MSWDTLAVLNGRFLEVLGVRVILALLAALVAWRLGVWARSSFTRVAARRGVDPSAQLLGARLIYGLIVAVGLIWALDIAGFELRIILTTFGVAGLALGLAVQDILKSFFAGLYLLFERPFLIGDEIQVKEHVGHVEHIGFRSTSVRTADNVLVVIPNSMLFVEAIGNRSQKKAAESGATSPEPTSSPAEVASDHQTPTRPG
jgi:small-conductance mechanosensitive channel